MASKRIRKERWPLWVLIAPLILLGVASARWIGSSLPVCLFHQTTGLFCPGCGATRSALALGEGRIGEALQNNLLFVLGVLLGGGWIILSGARQRYPHLNWLRIFQWRLWFLWLGLAAILVFTLMRNLSGFEFLAPE